MPRRKTTRSARPRFNPWTPKDIARLRQLAGTMPSSAIAKRLERSEAAVVFKAHTLRIPLSTRSRLITRTNAKGKSPGRRTATAKNYWTPAELRLVRQLAGSLPRRDIAKRLGRTDSALAYKAHTLRIPLEQKNRRPRGPKAGTRKTAPRPNPNAWTTAELRLLRQNAGKLSRAQLAKRLRRSPAAVTFKAFKERISLALKPAPRLTAERRR